MSEAPEATACLFWRLRDTTPPPWRPVVEFWTWSVFVQICFSSRSFAQTYKELLWVVLHQPRQRLLLHHPWHRFASNNWNECRLTSLGVSASRRVVARAWGSPKPRYTSYLHQMVSILSFRIWFLLRLPTQAINKSLSNLGQVIMALSQKVLGCSNRWSI